MTDTNIIGELITPSKLRIEVSFEYDQICITVIAPAMCRFILYIQDAEDAEAMAYALENGGYVNIDQQQSAVIARRQDDTSVSIARDDDYVSFYLPHLSRTNCQDLAALLRAGIEKLQAHKDEEAERHLSRRR